MKPLWEGAGVNSSPSFSPDGRQVAFASGADGNTDIFVGALEGGTPERLTSGRSIETQPAWSPNGRQIAFTSTAAGAPQLFAWTKAPMSARRSRTASPTRRRGHPRRPPRLHHAGRAPLQIAISTSHRQRTVVAARQQRVAVLVPDGTIGVRIGPARSRSTSRSVGVTRAITDEGNNSQPV
jgi:dipeptidyl aminopeptidase/acylaminoacyl peptidase